MQSHATMTLVSITGDSAQDLSTPTAPIIYAGFTGCTTGNGTDLCDTCTGEMKTGSMLWTCNKKSTYPSLVLTIRVQTTTAEASAANAVVKIGGESYPPTIPVLFADGVLTMQLRWTEICSHVKVDAGAQCDGRGNFTAELDVGFEVTGSGTTTTDTMKFKIIARIAPVDGSDWFYPDCRPGRTSTANTGACYFTVFPGDEKLYADNFSVSDEGYPNTANAGIKFTNVLFFYEQQASGDTDDITISKISNKSVPFSLGVNTAAKPPLADNRITGLTNGVRYCMVMANQDATGIISYFTPIPSVSGSPVTASELCTTPTPVVGLLDDKHCFIATAAFGTEMAPEVQSFREFRNKYLLSHSWGRSFVKFYYKHSPFYAGLIAESEVAKFIVRGALWPLLLFARMSVSLGFWISFMILSLLTVSFYALNRYWILKKKRFRGEI